MIMKNIFKTLPAILLICLGFVVLFLLFAGILGLSYLGCVGCMGCLVFGPSIGFEQMEEIFVEDYELLDTVVQFLVGSDYENVSIRRGDIANGEMHVSGIGSVPIEDVSVLEALEELANRGYSVIIMSNNTIMFQRWATRDSGRGVAFSMDGNDPVLQFLTRLEPLPKPNWFYYEDDFREWQRRREQED